MRSRQRCYVQFGQPVDLGRLAGKTLTSARQHRIRAQVAAQIDAMIAQLLVLRELRKPRESLLRRLLTR